MSLWHCTNCTTRYAVGLPACPHCAATGFLENGEPLPAKAWTCQTITCRAQYAVFLHNCPRCAGQIFELEDVMPKITVNSGASNGAAEPEAPVEPAAPAAEPKPAAEPADEPKPAASTRRTRARTKAAEAQP